MDYQLLSVYRYANGSSFKSDIEMEKAYQDRLHGYSTIVTNMYPDLDQKRMGSGNNGPLFFVQTNKINQLINQITRNSRHIKEIVAQWPNIAKSSYVRKLLTSEIYYTNEIEGVKTTKQEIGTVVGQLTMEKQSERRLVSTVRLYNAALTGKTYQIKDLADLRRIYDELLRGEISSDKKPDGKLFRNHPVYIGTASQKIHTPPATEQQIKAKLLPLIMFMNQDDVQEIVKAVVAHFMFENIHPFYDGNGRTGRYLLSSYLASKLDRYTGLSISTAIHTEQSTYYKAFKQADNWENRADVTLFLQQVLAIINDGQLGVIRNMKRLSEQLKAAYQKIQIAFVNPVQQAIVYALVQSRLFSENVETGIKDTELIDALYHDDSKKFHKNEVQRELKVLTDKGVITEIKKRPLQHLVAERYL